MLFCSNGIAGGGCECLHLLSLPRMTLKGRGSSYATGPEVRKIKSDTAQESHSQLPADSKNPGLKPFSHAHIYLKGLHTTFPKHKVVYIYAVTGTAHPDAMLSSPLLQPSRAVLWNRWQLVLFVVVWLGLSLSDLSTASPLEQLLLGSLGQPPLDLLRGTWISGGPTPAR